MSQYPPNPNYNPYEQRPNDPNASPGTAYGNTPSGGQNPPYNPYPGNPPSGPGSNPGQYGAYPPTPTPPPPPGAPNTDYNPYEQYAPTYVNTSPNAGYGQYQTPPPPPAYPPTQQAYQAPLLPTQAPTPKRKRPSTMLISLVVVALVVIVGGILATFIVVNGQKASADATATAQANASATANANATAAANATATANAALTATAVASTYPFSANQVLNDPLSDNSKGFSWQTGTDCNFSGNAYHVTDPQTNTFSTCFGSNTNFSNFTFQAEMVLSKGDGAGLIIRGNEKTDQIYRLSFYTDGTYDLYVYVDNTGTNARILKTGSYASSSIDLTVTHTIAVVANGSTFTMYFDNQMISTVTDSSYTSGEIGFTSSDVSNAADAIFTNAKVWKLP